MVEEGEGREGIPGRHQAREGATAAARPTAVTHRQWETLGAREGLKEAERKPPPPPLHSLSPPVQSESSAIRGWAEDSDPTGCAEDGGGRRVRRHSAAGGEGGRGR